MAVELLNDRQMNHTISHLEGVKRAVYGVANEIGGIASSRLAPHKKTFPGAHIVVSQGDVDAFASLVDEAALSIEFGHFLGPRTRGLDRQFVQGLGLFIDWYYS